MRLRTINQSGDEYGSQLYPTEPAILFIPGTSSFSLASAIFSSVLADRVPEAVFIVQDYGRSREEVDCSFVSDMLLIRPTVVAFSCFFWNLEYHLTLAALAKKLNPKVRTVLGGPQTGKPTYARDLLAANQAVDFVLTGEADLVFPELVRRILIDEDVAGIPGLVHRINGNIQVPPDSATVVDLSEIPPAYHDDSAYVTRWLSTLDIIPLQTIRGCRNSCSYCMYRTPRLRFLPDDRVHAEIEFLCRKGVQCVRVCDSHFGGSRERALGFFDKIRSVNRGTRFFIYPDPQHLNQEYIQAAKAAQCTLLSLGVETMDPEVAVRVRRQGSKKGFDTAFACLQTAGQSIQVDLMFGLPGQSEGSFLDDVINLRASGAKRLLFSPLMLFPGTQLDEAREEQGLEVLPSPQRFAKPQSLATDNYTRMFKVVELHKLLGVLHRTELLLMHSARSLPERHAILRRLFRVCTRSSGHEMSALLFELRGNAAYIRQKVSDLAKQAVHLMLKSSPQPSTMVNLLQQSAKTDLLEEAMRRRRSELRNSPNQPSNRPRVWLAEEVARQTWIIDKECWLEDNASLCLRLFDCRSAKIYKLKPYDAEFLRHFYVAHPPFCDNHPFTQARMKRVCRWIERGILVPAAGAKENEVGEEWA